MIFKKLFRPKHQDHDPKVRIKAVEALSPNDPEQKTVLHELAFNDADASVSLAALTQLDSFALWYKMSEIAKDERVQNKARKIVENELLTEQEGRISQKEKLTYIKECRYSPLLEKLVELPWLQEQQPEQLIKHLVHLDKSQLNQKVFYRCDKTNLRLAILSEQSLDGFKDEVELNRVLRKINDAEVCSAARQKLQKLIEKREKPKQLAQQTRLVLSRLLALKDSKDFVKVKQQHAELVAEYDRHASDFSCLDESVQDEFNCKYADILPRVEAQLARLEALWVEAQVVAQAAELSKKQQQEQQEQYQKKQAEKARLAAERKAEQQEHQQEKGRIRHKLRNIDNLIERGKFNAALSVYARLSQDLEKVSDKSRQALSALIERTQEKVQNLQEWKAYLVEPRKPELLEAVKTLIDAPLDIDEQARQVKTLRKQWNSLGKLNTEQDSSLNAEFDLLIEEAFTPCRQHYAAMEQERADNLASKKAVLAKLAGFPSLQLSAEEAVKFKQTITDEWKKTGEIDYKHLESLNRAFKEAMQAPRELAQAYYKANSDAKRQLLHEAERLLKLDDVQDAANQAKVLQQKWQTIKQAKRKDENELWTAFRKVNDDIFSRLAAARGEQKALERQAAEHARKQAKDAKEQAQQAKLQEQQVAKVKAERIQQQYRQLFMVLRDWQHAELPEQSGDLNHQWLQCMRMGSENEKSSQNGGRDVLTLKMEIIAQRPSPESQQQQRRDVQLELLAAKLQQGSHEDLEQLLKYWIQQGPLSAHELTLLNRVENVFLHCSE